MSAGNPSVVVILSTEAEFSSKLESLLSPDRFVVVATDSADRAAEEAAARRATVVIIGPSIPRGDMLEAAEVMLSADTPPAVVAVAIEVDTELMRKAMRAGIHDMLCAGEQTWVEVVAAIEDADADVASHNKEADVEAKPESLGAVIAVMGTKGGVGKSVVATNIAACLAEMHKRVVLVDLDLHSGDTGIMLSLEPIHTIRDAAIASDRLDAPMLSGLLTEHKSGARVLLAPARPEDSDVVTATRVGGVLRLLRHMADYVVVDTPSAWDETTLAAVDASDSILAITGMDVPSVKNTAVMLSRLKQLGRLDGNVRVVLNRADSKVLIDEKDVEKALGYAVSSRVPSDRAVPRSVNMGVPIVMEAPRSSVAKALVGLSRSVSANGV